MNKEESLLDDETLFKEYMAAAITGLLAYPGECGDAEKNAAAVASSLLKQHRKRFPKRIK